MKFVLITGVSTGIGHSLTKKFLDSGYKVIGNVRSEKKGEKLKTILGDHFYPVTFDLLKTAEIDTATYEVKKILGDNYLSGLINNAGAADIGPLLHVSMEQFRQSLELLVISQLYIIQKFFSYLIPPSGSKMEKGRIINISSVSGVNSNYGYGTYSAGKHALEGMSKTLRKEISNIYGIKIIVVRPANVKTALWNKQVLESIEKYKKTAYYYPLKNMIIKSTSPQSLNQMMDSDEFSTKFLQIFEKTNPSEKYTIKKSKFHFGKSKIGVWKSIPLLESILSKTGQL